MIIVVCSHALLSLGFLSNQSDKVMVNKQVTTSVNFESNGIVLDENQNHNQANGRENRHKGNLSRRSTTEVESAIVAIETTLRQHEKGANKNCDIFSPFNGFLEAFTRKKPLDGRTETNLNRCLNLLDLTTLGKL